MAGTTRLVAGSCRLAVVPAHTRTDVGKTVTVRVSTGDGERRQVLVGINALFQVATFVGRILSAVERIFLGTEERIRIYRGDQFVTSGGEDLFA